MPSDSSSSGRRRRQGTVSLASTGTAWRAPWEKGAEIAYVERHGQVGIGCEVPEEWDFCGKRARVHGNPALVGQVAEAARASRWKPYVSQRTALRVLDKGRDEEVTMQHRRIAHLRAMFGWSQLPLHHRAQVCEAGLYAQPWGMPRGGSLTRSVCW